MPDNKHKNGGIDRTRSVGMNKKIILSAVFMIVGNYLFSQTWTERNSRDGYDIDYKVITKDEWYRLLKQKEAQYPYAMILFQDALEPGDEDKKVIKGKSPQLRGCYYLGTTRPTTDKSKNIMRQMGLAATALYYENDKTGAASMGFLNSNGRSLDNTYFIGGDAYNRRFKQVMDWVDGK